MWSLPTQLLLALLSACFLLNCAIADDADGDTDQCSSTQFTCDNGRCISLAWQCDDDDDCSDGSDEKNCSSTTCGSKDFKCVSDHKCIPLNWKCDEANDCADKSDEDPAVCKPAECDTEHEHKCGDGKCVDKAWLCDGQSDCDDGSDEANCDMACSETEFKCKESANCISKKWQCDGSDDCLDGSDELDCPARQCKAGEFNCTNGDCIDENWRCDGDDDCGDSSDEQACDAYGLDDNKCRENEFQCKTLDRLCIHSYWKCDGDNDCEDHSDEKGCNITCKEDQFKCDANYCIHESLRCDGSEDCLNGSDEKGCPKKNLTCAEDEFDCNGDGTQCIDLELVCNKWAHDCDNHRDEENCTDDDPCKKDGLNGGCQHNCFHTQAGRTCTCHAGFQLVNGSETECEDVNECSIMGTCSQVCTNTKGSFKCSCHEGYRLEEGTKCKASVLEPQLLFADRKDLRRLHLGTKAYTTLVSKDTVRAIALDFHLAKNFVYWSDATNQSIKRVNTKTSVIETVAQDNVKTPDGLAVDWVHDKLYWTDTGLNRIEVASLDGKMRKVLITNDLDEPRAIVLHPKKGLMFWTDWGKNPKIESCGMNGDPATRTAIISQQITWPNGMTIDYVDDRLYWADAKTHEIGSSNLDGSGRRKVLSTHQFLGHPWAITVFEDFLYWTDWTSNAIHRYNKFSKGEVEYVTQHLETPMDIHIYHQYRQMSSENKCGSDNGGCEHFCLPSPLDVKFTCECATNFTVSPTDPKKCVAGTAPAPASTSSPAAGTTQKPAPTAAPTAKPTTPAPAGTPKPTTPAAAVSVSTLAPDSGVTQDARNNTEGGAAANEDEPTDGMGHIAIIVIAVVLCLAIIIIVVGVIVFRRYRNKNIKSMNFDNPVYRKTTTEDKVFMEHSGSRQNLNPSMQPLNPDHEVA